MRNLRMPMLAAARRRRRLQRGRHGHGRAGRVTRVRRRLQAGRERRRTRVSDRDGRRSDRRRERRRSASPRSSPTTRASQDKAAQQPALDGAAANQPIGHAPPRRQIAQARARRRARRPGGPGTGDGKDHKGGKRAKAKGVTADPLVEPAVGHEGHRRHRRRLLRQQQGSHDVRVGIIDTGIDGSHPDIAPNFDPELSPQLHRRRPGRSTARATDEPDKSCYDRHNVDENGHGTHVAGTIGAALNGVGIARRRAQGRPRQPARRPGLGLLLPRPDARRADVRRRPRHRRREHVATTSIRGCTTARRTRRDSPAEQREQRLIISATQRAIDYARDHGVTHDRRRGQRGTPTSASPTSDDTSPDYPDARASPHTATSTTAACHADRGQRRDRRHLDRPDRRKAYYSNYGLEQTDVSAPGGDVYAHSKQPTAHRTRTRSSRRIRRRSRARRASNPDGSPKTPNIVRDCQNGGLRVLPVPAGHVDGLAARGRRRGARGRAVRHSATRSTAG